MLLLKTCSIVRLQFRGYQSVISTHSLDPSRATCVTDLSIVNPNAFGRGGLALMYPLSWETGALELVRPDNWLGTTLVVAAAVLMWLV